MRRPTEKIRKAQSTIRSSSSVCSACGNSVTRDFARFCRVCGKSLGEDYEPLDNLRSSYNLQRKKFEFDPHTVEKTEKLFEVNENKASSTASAFVVYSLVPYLGILFCPGALLMGGIGAIVSYRKPYLGGGRTSVYSIVLSLIIFVIQILLWWLLYIVPELSK